MDAWEKMMKKLFLLMENVILFVSTQENFEISCEILGYQSDKYEKDSFLGCSAYCLIRVMNCHDGGGSIHL